jgi:hypothetical protein
MTIFFIVLFVSIALYQLENAWHAQLDRQEARHQEMLDRLEQLAEKDDDDADIPADYLAYAHWASGAWENER